MIRYETANVEPLFLMYTLYLWKYIPRIIFILSFIGNPLVSPFSQLRTW